MHENGTPFFNKLRKIKETVEILNIQKELKKYNMKTCKYEKYKNNLIERNKILDKLFNFYNKKFYRNLNFKKYINTQKSEDQLIKKIKSFYKEIDEETGKEKEIVLIYGNWSRKSQMKYSAPTPNIGIRRKLGKEFNLYLIDEYKTSKLCNTCKCETENRIIKKEKKNVIIEPNRRQYKQHSLLSCKNFKCNKLWNRDVNGSLNILEIGISIINNNGRPICFQRNDHPLVA